MKPIISIFILIFIWLMCIATKCQRASEKCHKTIAFVNNSQMEVYIQYCFTFQDTSIFYKTFPNPYKESNLYSVKQGKKNTSGIHRTDCFEYDVSQNNIVIFVFDAEILATVPWETVGKNYMVLKTYRPTLEEMQRNDWTIYYTGK